MVAVAVLTVIVLGVSISVAARLRGIAGIPLLFWLLLLSSTAMPLAVGWIVLNPGESLSSETVKAEKEKVNLVLPEKHSLMITAKLSPPKKNDSQNAKTSYSLRVQGDDWSQKFSGTVTRDSEEGIDVDVYNQENIGSSGKKKASGFGEDRQERFDPAGHGPILIEVSNYQGSAAENLLIEVIPSPPAPSILWAIAGFIALIGIYLEAWKSCDKASFEIAFLAFYGVFLSEGVTPLDGWSGVGGAALPALFLAYPVVGVAWLSQKYLSSQEEEEEEEGLGL